MKSLFFAIQSPFVLIYNKTVMYIHYQMAILPIQSIINTDDTNLDLFQVSGFCPICDAYCQLHNHY